MYWTNLDNKKIAVWGMGQEGQSVWHALETHCHGIELFEITEDNTADIFKCDVLIKSPGVSLYRAEIQEAMQKGIVLTSGTNLFFANKNHDIPVLSVTGTKGKSTTAALLAHTLKYMGKTAILGGNIGKPLIDFVDETPDFFVAELSSYQCADFVGQPDVGILVNLYPEHLQWHGDHERYYADKLRMIRSCRQMILNAQNEQISLLTSDLNADYFNYSGGFHVSDGMFMKGSEPLFSVSYLPLPGLHNAENACAVLTVVDLMGFQADGCQGAFETFQALPHRLQIVGIKDGITYIDDSISTTPETALAGLKAIDKGQSITLIAGGLDRGQDYRELVCFLSRNKERMQLVTLPDTGGRLAESAQKVGVKTSLTSDMPTAVNIAQHLTPAGGTILLSPAAPSYNQYRNFEERGRDFCHWAGLSEKL